MEPTNPPPSSNEHEAGGDTAASSSVDEAPDPNEYFRLVRQALIHKQGLEHAMDIYTKVYDWMEGDARTGKVLTRYEQEVLVGLYNWVVSNYKAWGEAATESVHKNVKPLDITYVDSELVKSMLEKKNPDLIHFDHDAFSTPIDKLRTQLKAVRCVTPKLYGEMKDILVEMSRRWNNGDPIEYDDEDQCEYPRTYYIVDLPRDPEEFFEYVVECIETIYQNTEGVGKHREFVNSFCERIIKLKEDYGMDIEVKEYYGMDVGAQEEQES